MEILSYPVALVIGLFPVIVDLGGQPGPARLSLDGRPVCEVTVKAPACMIDLGPDPRVHRLDLERLDGNGKVVEAIHRWVNRPTPEGRVRAVGSCDEKKRECEFQVQWAHPARLDPQTLTVALDGKRVRGGVSEFVRVPFPRGKVPQVFTVEAVFPDGLRAEYTQVLHGINPEEARASLHPIAIEVPRDAAEKDIEARLRDAGWRIRAIDEGEVEILFVIQPKAISRFSMSTSEVSRNPARYGGALEGLGPLWFVVADETLALLQPSAVGEHAQRWLPAMMTMSSRGSLARVRIADAVAAGAYRLGGVPHRRIMVLVLGPHDALQPDTSAVSPAQALAYLREVSVPLVVWRVDVRRNSSDITPKVGADRGEWPAGDWIRGAHDFPKVIAHLRETIDRQRLIWLEEAADTEALDRSLPTGFVMAGAAKETVSEPRHPGSPPSPLRTVYAVTADPHEPGAIYAGTAGGLLRTCDSGETWTRVEIGSPGGVFSLAFAGSEKTRLLGGGSGALFRSAPTAAGWSALSLPTVFSIGVDPGNSSVLYAGTRGHIFKSQDGGLEWTEVSGGVSSFALALAVQPGNSAIVYAGTAGSGVFKSSDGGRSWEEAGKELQTTAVRGLAIDPANPTTLYAGTDGGVFVSVNAGKSWTPAGIGLPRVITYAVAVGPGRPKRVVAGTSAGLFVSEDRGGSWRRVSNLVASVTSLTFDSDGDRLIAGTLGEGVIVLPADELDAGKGPAFDERQEAAPPDSPMRIPPGILPSSATGPTLPFAADLSGVKRRGFNRSAMLRMTLRIKPVFDAMTKKAPARLSVKVVAESPAARTTVRSSGATVDFDATVETWTLEVPVKWSVNTTRLIVTVVEEATGAHGVAIVEPPGD